MHKTYILVAPATPRGKFSILKLRVGGVYGALYECPTQHAAELVLQALVNNEFTSRLTQVARQAAE